MEITMIHTYSTDQYVCAIAPQTYIGVNLEAGSFFQTNEFDLAYKTGDLKHIHELQIIIPYVSRIYKIKSTILELIP
jgi:hypothetical protein